MFRELANCHKLENYCKIYLKIVSEFGPWSSTVDKQYTRADMSGSGTNIAINDWLRLDQDQRHVWTSLNNPTRIIQDLPGACTLQMQGWLREKVQMQEGQAGMHTTVCLRWGVLSEL